MIADQIMPGMKGVELLEEVHRRCPRTTKILLTGQAGLDAVVDAINRADLNHYIPKPWDETELRLAVENLLRQYRLERENASCCGELSAKNPTLREMNRELEAKIDERTHELAEANARLAQLAVTDGLTGLYNHRHFHERLSLEVERSERTGLPLSLLMIDVDHFKQYNDRHGHPAGDEVLRGVSQILQHGRRANDVVARYGGEEFAIILLDVGKSAAKEVAERICAAGRRVPVRVRQHAAAPASSRSRSASRRSPTTAPSPRWCWPRPTARCTRPRTPAATEFASPGRRLCKRRSAGRRRLGRRARRGSPAGAATTSRCGRSTLRRRPRWRERRASDRSVAGVPPPGRGRGDRPTSRRRWRGRDMLVVVTPSAFVAPTLRGRARGGRAGAHRRVRVERPRAGDRRHDGRGDRGQPAGRARRRAVRAQLRAGDRERPSRGAGGGVRGSGGRERRAACFSGGAGRAAGPTEYRLRIYTSDDVAGVCIGGALKNVIAIAVGCCDGFGFGDNARAALITRGLAEMGRLAERMGGRALTLAGLAGLGDLVLTCTGDLSRNRQVGLALARGDSLADIAGPAGSHRRGRRHLQHGAPAGAAAGRRHADHARGRGRAA